MTAKKAVFIDIDGTLLRMRLEDMFKDYHSLLAQSGALRSICADGEKAMEIYNGAIDHMINNFGEKRNDETFFGFIEENSGAKRAEVEGAMEEFFAGGFDLIKEYCEKPALQREILDILKEKGYRLIAATYPVFPIAAAKTRLKWAGVSAEDFELISDYTVSSFYKPDLRYYEELLKTAGLKASECIMIGNDFEQDMCARKLGFDVFFLKGYEIGENTAGVPEGDLEALCEYVKKLPKAGETA